MIHGDIELNGDTSFYHIPDFSFTDQNDSVITQKWLEDKIYLTNFFFTSCQSICPKMNTNMHIIYEKFKNNPNVKFLSHTVDPDTDTVRKTQGIFKKIPS